MSLVEGARFNRGRCHQLFTQPLPRLSLAPDIAAADPIEPGTCTTAASPIEPGTCLKSKPFRRQIRKINSRRSRAGGNLMPLEYRWQVGFPLAARSRACKLNLFRRRTACCPNSLLHPSREWRTILNSHLQDWTILHAVSLLDQAASLFGRVWR